MTTVNLVSHLDLAAHRNSRSLLTGFHIRAAIARAAHIEQEGITSVRTSASDRYVSTDDRGRHSGGLGAIERLLYCVAGDTSGFCWLAQFVLREGRRSRMRCPQEATPPYTMVPPASRCTLCTAAWGVNGSAGAGE